MRKVKLLVLFAFILMIAVLLIQTAMFPSRQLQVAEAPKLAIDETTAARHLSGALKIRTVSYQDPAKIEWDQFAAFRAYVKETYPATHSAFELEEIGGGSLLYMWEGSDPSAKPIVLMAHMDVVPAETGKWTRPPFAGEIADGQIWGRGAMDDKSSLISILEAAEILAAQGKKPRRTIYFAFGHDEELGGKGAADIAALLKSRGIQPEFVLDEGLAVTRGILPLEKPVAMIGIAEKGYLTIRITVTAEGGHSSAPPAHTAIGILSRAVQEIENHPLPASLKGPARRTMEYIGPEFPWHKRIVFANLWLFEPVLVRAMLAEPGSASSIRTTTAVTMIEGGIKDNVLPTQASASVNFRILPGETVESVIDHVRKVIDSDQVKIEPGLLSLSVNPSAVSPVDSDAFRLIHRSVKEVIPESLVAPGLVTGATDSRHFAGLTANVFRFAPFCVTTDDIKTIHGADEKVSIRDFATMVGFYVQLMKNAAW